MREPAGDRSTAEALAVACGVAVAPWLAARVTEVVPLPPMPDRAEFDPVLDRLGDRRLVVFGSDAALAAVVRRLLRTSRLDAVAVGFVPAGPSSAVAELWGLPADPE